MYDLLRGRNAGLKDEMISFARQLVSTPGASREEARVADRVEHEMTTGGYDKVCRDDAGNVIGIMFGRNPDRTVLLNCHLDTVSPKDSGAWTASPWSGHIADDRLHGVGAADCKGGLAAQVYAGLLLKRAMLPLRGNLVVAATVAEENGRSAGLRALLERTLPELNLKPMFALLGEPTNLGLYYGHHGWFELEIRVEAADPPTTANAATVIYNQFAAACASRDGTDRPETVAISEPSFARTPDGALATIHMARRIASADDVDDVLGQVKQTAVLAARSIGSVSVDVAIWEETQQLYNGTTAMVRHVTHAWETDPFHPLLVRARDALVAGGCEATPGKWKLGRLGMATGGGLLVNDFKVPTIGYGPGSEDLAHAPNEYVELANIPRAAYGTALIVHSLIGVPVFGWTFDDEI
jgi:acetylornithine deacetylase/succinyl-diaminopimelate desuccinylase-like protein